MCARGAIAMGGTMPLTVYIAPERFSFFSSAVANPVFVMVT